MSPLHSLQHHQKWFTRDPVQSPILGSCDTDTDEEGSDIPEGSRLSDIVPIESWCSCGLCIRLPSEIENYCCRESTCLLDSILQAKGIPCVLKLCAFGMDQRKLPVYKNGKIKPEGCNRGNKKTVPFRPIHSL